MRAYNSNKGRYERIKAEDLVDKINTKSTEGIINNFFFIVIKFLIFSD